MEIQLNENGIQIGENSPILLASSLFYFRIPRERWDQRMKLLKTAGYNTIDVYFPWNYHERSHESVCIHEGTEYPGDICCEPTEGEGRTETEDSEYLVSDSRSGFSQKMKKCWDFEENRDVEQFLQLAAENELYVIARPGPYICSEWDGGAIPARLYAEHIPVRQDDPAFLREMENWYSHILPIIARHQITAGGTVICMQIENELDYYDCRSPVTYMDKLKRMAESFGIEVPLFYCCGQDNIVKSGGLTEGLYSAFNVYSSGDFKGLEQRALYLYEAAALRKMPFLITETNREHDYLKRLLACGAKLLGPYNQTAGTTMDFYTGITNWGSKESPVAIMATDYDFKSMIGSAGEYGAELYRARLFAGLLHTFGDALGAGKPQKSSVVILGDHVNEVVPMLVTKRGSLLDVSNLGTAQTVKVFLGEDIEGSERKKAYENTAAADFECPVSDSDCIYEVSMEACETKLLPLDVMVTDEMQIHFSNYELASIQRDKGMTLVWLYGSGAVQLTLKENGVSSTLRLSEPENGRKIQKGKVYFCFGRYDYVSEKALPFLPKLAVLPENQEEDVSGLEVKMYDCRMKRNGRKEGRIQPMEYFGQDRGIGTYEMTLPQDGTYLLSGLADIITISQMDKRETFYANGSTAIKELHAGNLEIMTEIWGHSNFDDIRVKSLKMGSLKGVESVTQILRTEDLTNGWVGYETEGAAKETCYFQHSPYHAIMSVDGYNRAVSPLVLLINRTILSPQGEDGLFLHFEKADCIITVYVNNQKVASVVKDDPYVDLSQYAGRGKLELTLHVLRRYYTDEIGQVTLFSGKKVQSCSFFGIEPEKAAVRQETLPMRMREQDSMLEVYADAASGEDLKLYFTGKNVKLTVYAGHHVMGRIYLSEKENPTVAGGIRNTSLILGEWLEKEPVSIWCQALGEKAVLEKIEVKRYKDGVSR